ncbi:MAG: hypothetical protein SNJ77_08040 [Cytophagales bacterium]
MAVIDPHHSLLWQKQLLKLKLFLGKTPDLNAILFLIGVQELGKGNLPYSKEQKQDLMSLATCRLLEPLGFFKLDGHDEDGWPVYVQQESLPVMPLQQQEFFLQQQIIEYFKNVEGLSVLK